MKIAIAGFGIEGRSSYDYYASLGHDITIVDERSQLGSLPDGASSLTGSEAFSQLDGFDMVIRSAGVAPTKIKTDGKIWSATNEFFAQCPAPIIGVTGTKGKGTASSLIAAILRAAGQTVHLVGNIGVPALGALANVQPDDVVVYELSSFQLWDLAVSPHVAVILMIESDHLDVHADFTDYLNAKTQIVNHQSVEDVVIFNQNNQFSQQIAIKSSAGSQLGYPIDMTHFKDAINLPGQHNLDNAAAAILAARSILEIDDSTIRQGLSSFAGLPHRLQLVRRVAEVDYYDDSIATTPGSAIAAIHSFVGPKILILGGSSKGADFGELAAIAANSNVSRIVAIGQEADRITEEFQAAGVLVDNLGGDQTMTDIVERVAKTAQAGEVVIMSPACASFDMFTSYQDRGQQFIEAVNRLKV